MADRPPKDLRRRPLAEHKGEPRPAENGKRRLILRTWHGPQGDPALRFILANFGVYSAPPFRPRSYFFGGGAGAFSLVGGTIPFNLIYVTIFP